MRTSLLNGLATSKHQMTISIESGLPFPQRFRVYSAGASARQSSLTKTGSRDAGSFSSRKAITSKSSSTLRPR